MSKQYSMSDDSMRMLVAAIIMQAMKDLKIGKRPRAEALRNYNDALWFFKNSYIMELTGLDFSYILKIINAQNKTSKKLDDDELQLVIAKLIEMKEKEAI